MPNSEQKKAPKQKVIIPGIKLSLSVLWKESKAVFSACILAIIMRVALPYLTILMPKVVIDQITIGATPRQFLLIVGGMTILLVVVNAFKAFSDPLVDNYKVREYLDSVGFSERLDSMQDGQNTILYKNYNEDGTTISGGEAQKLALARALYKNAPIVVLDEPTAALDPIAEYEIYTTFDRTIGDKTAIFISHRLSSCRFCHRIAVFDAGSLVQIGTHEKLLSEKDGRYYALWEAQAEHYRMDNE